MYEPPEHRWIDLIPQEVWEECVHIGIHDFLLQLDKKVSKRKRFIIIPK